MQRQLGFADERHPIVVRLSTAAGPWLMASTHRPGGQQLPDWFDFYVAALAESLNAALENELTRTTGEIMQHLLEGESPRQALTHAIRAVGQALSADAGLRNGLNVIEGRVVHAAVARDLGLPAPAKV